MAGRILVVGFGPGSYQHMTERARQAIVDSDVIIGYNTYVDLVRGLLTGQEIVRTGMTEEVSRAQKRSNSPRRGGRWRSFPVATPASTAWRASSTRC